MVKNGPIEKMEVNGGVLCLDFVNTVNHRFKRPVRSYLTRFPDLLYWALHKAHIIDEAECVIMERESAKHPIEAEISFWKAIELRELLYRVFLGVGKDALPPGKDLRGTDLDHLNGIIGEYFAHLQLHKTDNGYSPGWAWERGHFCRLTAPIVRTAFELLQSDRLNRVKACPNCGWLFLDATKNGKRRWCSMKSCGSNVKATQYYHRKKAE